MDSSINLTFKSQYQVTNKLSTLISIHFLEKLVEKICFKIKASSKNSDDFINSYNPALIMYMYLI